MIQYSCYSIPIFYVQYLFFVSKEKVRVIFMIFTDNLLQFSYICLKCT